MVKKPSQKKRAKTFSRKTKFPIKSKIVHREPTPAAILKKVAAVSDSTNGLQREIKAMSKIFGDNQKVLVSMKRMIDTLTSTLENIQKQSFLSWRPELFDCRQKSLTLLLSLFVVH